MVNVFRLTIMLAAGLGWGLTWNAVSGQGIDLRGNVYLREGDELVDAGAAKRRLDQGALFLDARPVAFYEMGHVPGALPLPQDDFEAALPRVQERLQGRFDIIVYCSGYGCEASHIVARELKRRGIPAAILQEGWPAWQEAGYPVERGREP